MMLICLNCDQARICAKRKNLNAMCRSCQVKESKKKAKVAKQKVDFESRTAPQSKTGFDKLTKEERTVRVKKLNNQRRAASKAYNRLVERFSLVKKKVELSEGMAKHYRKAMEEALTTNNSSLRSSLREILFEVIQEEAKSGKKGNEATISMDQVDDFINHVEESMKNLVRDLKGNKNQCRYSPQTMALAMSLYIKAGPSAYEQFKNDSVIVMPAATTLAEIRQKQGVRDGCCIAVYESQLLMRPTRLEIGQVMCDEMKLQKDVLINVKNGKIIGFSNDFVDMKKIVKNLLDEDEIESYAKPATHVNQWRYRAVDGRSFVCEFWYNHGELTGKGLLRQFNQVVMRCEEMGSIVLGMVCDAGGSNAGLFTQLREKAVLEEGGWVSLDMVRTKNPWEPSRFVYLFHCATHDLKAMRNAFFTSWVKNGKRRPCTGNACPVASPMTMAAVWYCA